MKDNNFESATARCLCRHCMRNTTATCQCSTWAEGTHTNISGNENQPMKNARGETGKPQTKKDHLKSDLFGLYDHTEQRDKKIKATAKRITKTHRWYNLSGLCNKDAETYPHRQTHSGTILHLVVTGVDFGPANNIDSLAPEFAFLHVLDQRTHQLGISVIQSHSIFFVSKYIILTLP